MKCNYCDFPIINDCFRKRTITAMRRACRGDHTTRKKHTTTRRRKISVQIRTTGTISEITQQVIVLAINYLLIGQQSGRLGE